MRTPQRPIRRGAAITGIAVAAAFSPLGTTAEPPPAPPVGASFREVIDVELVNVEAWVTDHRGEPVLGLTAEDFEIREDGKPVPISHFAEVRDDPPLPDLRQAAGPSPAIEAAPSPAPLSGHLVLYFDELHLGADGRRRVIDDLRPFLEAGAVPPEKVLILRQERELRVEAGFGATPSQLEAALDRLAVPSEGAAMTAAEADLAVLRLQQMWEEARLQNASDPTGGDPCPLFLRTAPQEVAAQARLSAERISSTLGHLGHTAAFLAGLPGLKTLLYVSDGLSTTPGRDLMAFVASLCPEERTIISNDLLEGMSAPFHRLTRHANANRVTIYPLQAGGLRHGRLSVAGQPTVAPGVFGRFESESRLDARRALTLLADDTGGRAILNKGRFDEELAAIAGEMSSYYSLAYRPPHRGDGLEHRIDIRVRGRGLRVRHRDGYRDKGPEQRMVERLESTLFLNLMANPLDVRLGAGQVQMAEGKKLNVPLHVIVPVDRITFLPREDGEVGSLRVQLLAQDEHHRRTAFRQEIFRVARPTEATGARTLSLVLAVDLPPGIHVVALGVRDEATQETSYVSTGLEL